MGSDSVPAFPSAEYEQGCLSGVTPVYNEVKTVAEVIEGVLAQSAVPELIVVDVSNSINQPDAFRGQFFPQYSLKILISPRTLCLGLREVQRVPHSFIASFGGRRHPSKSSSAFIPSEARFR